MSQSKKQVAPKKLKKAQTSKEQKAQEKETLRQREFVKQVLWPFLVNNTKTIPEAKRLCQEIITSLTQSFQKRVIDVQKELSGLPTKEYALTDVTNKGKDFKVNKALYELFKDESLATINNLLNGMPAAIDSFINEEMAGRELSSLKTTFL